MAISTVGGFLRRLVPANRRQKEQGVALVAVVVVLTVMAAAAADFAYSTKVDYSSAINARDELKAYYLGRSAINLAQLLLRVQQKVIEPNRQMFGGFDFQIADYAPLLISAFNSKESGAMLGSVLGVDTGNVKGLGLEGGSFDLEMESLDGRLNLNCAGGTNTDAPAVKQFATALAAMILPQRYNPIFERQNEKGEFFDRAEVARAIIDWADQDMVTFGSTSTEDYRYNASGDPYEIKNQYFDTLEELRLVRGVGEDFMSSFADQLTVYGGCKINVGIAGAPLLTALILHYAATPNDPALDPRNLTLLVRYLLQIRSFTGGFNDAKAFVQAVENPSSQLNVVMALNSLVADADKASTQPKSLPPVTGVKLNPSVSEAIAAGAERRVWQFTATAEVGRVNKRIVVVWDNKHISMQASQQLAGPGGILYWREE